MRRVESVLHYRDLPDYIKKTKGLYSESELLQKMELLDLPKFSDLVEQSIILCGFYEFENTQQRIVELVEKDTGLLVSALWAFTNFENVNLTLLRKLFTILSQLEIEARKSKEEHNKTDSQVDHILRMGLRHSSLKSISKFIKISKEFPEIEFRIYHALSEVDHPEIWKYKSYIHEFDLSSIFPATKFDKLRGGLGLSNDSLNVLENIWTNSTNNEKTRRKALDYWCWNRDSSQLKK